MIDLLKVDDDVETVVVCSGGGARGLWQWTLLLLLAKRFKISMICGCSAGTLNSYGFAKGLHEYVTNLYKEVFSMNAVQITSPGLAKLENGRFRPNVKKIKEILLKGVSVLSLPSLLFEKGQEKFLDKILNNFLGAPALMDNAPLYQTVRKLHELNPGFDIPVFWNETDMKTGKGIQREPADFKGDIEAEVKSVVASTTIPILWPLVSGRYADGGLRDGTPLKQIFDKLDPNKKYRIIVLLASKEEMQDATDLSNPLKVAGQIASIMMNESTLNDLARVEDRNEEARKYGEAPGRRLVPVYKLVYGGFRDPLDFSPESYVDQIYSAHESDHQFLSEFDKVA